MLLPADTSKFRNLKKSFAEGEFPTPSHAGEGAMLLAKLGVPNHENSTWSLLVNLLRSQGSLGVSMF